MATLHAEVPQQLWQQAQNMVDRGWVSNLDALVSESLQRYLESHQEALSEQFIREDVEWGCRKLRQRFSWFQAWGNSPAGP